MISVKADAGPDANTGADIDADGGSNANFAGACEGGAGGMGAGRVEPPVVASATQSYQ